MEILVICFTIYVVITEIRFALLVKQDEKVMKLLADFINADWNGGDDES